ncbi:MAG TPA: Holliday junction resolvase RuvX [Acidimicrobiales bacterium]|nr:Holliday junction resolvase RuvX [Acidimicrobiales bacterium]
MIPDGRVIGLDLGSRRIGVAVTDAGQALATPAVTINRATSRDADHRAIAGLVEEYGAVGVVVGLPISLSGDIGQAALGVLEEVEELRSAIGVEIATVDERLTTVTAAASIRAAGVRSRRHRNFIDQAAAAEILQTWIERRKAPIR